MTPYKIEHHSKKNGRFQTSFLCEQINSYSLNYWLLACSTDHFREDIKNFGFFFVVKTIKTEKHIKTINTKELLEINELLNWNYLQNYKEANNLLNKYYLKHEKTNLS